MDKNTKILLNKSRSAEAVNVNTTLDFNIKNTNKPLPLNDIDTTLSQYEQFLKERKASTIYRFYGEINCIVSNPLYNENVKIAIDKNNVNNIIAKPIPGYDIFEKDGWVGYINDIPNEELELVGDNESSLCEFFPFDPSFDRLNMLDPDGKPNYMLKLTYPNSIDVTLQLVRGGAPIVFGIPIITQLGVSFNGSNYVAFQTPINHGLQPNDTIKLYNFIDNTGGNLALPTREFSVFKLGDQNGNNTARIFVLNIGATDINFTLSSTFKRITQGVISQYYVRNFKALTFAYTDYDIYPAAFGVNYFKDNIAAFNFIKDIDVDGIVDNLGRPLSEIYLTIVKNDNDADLTTKNAQYWLEQQANLPADIKDRFWTKIKGGFLTEKNTSLNYNIRAIGDPDYSSSIWYENIDESDNDFVGDIVEYNEAELLERRLEEVYHRINTIYRENLETIASSNVINNTITGTYRGDQGDNILFTAAQALSVSDFPQVQSDIHICFTNRLTQQPACIEVGLTYIDTVNPSVQSISLFTGNHDLHDVLQDTDEVIVSFDGCPCSVEGETLGNKNEGYIYRPHIKLQIREFSSVINPLLDLQTIFNQYNISDPAAQQEIKDDYEVPSYAQQPSPNVFRWRRLLEIGEIDPLGKGVDYPFESGAHYIHIDERFYWMRQDPPCDFYLTSKTIKIPSEKSIFPKLMKDPTFLDYGPRRTLDLNIIRKVPLENILDYDGLVGLWSTGPLAYGPHVNKIAQCSNTNDPIETPPCFYNKKDALNHFFPPYAGSWGAGFSQALHEMLLTSTIRHEELEIDMRFIHFYGDYNLGKRDTAGACVNFNILDRKDITDDC
jgi:hypothetical protein